VRKGDPVTREQPWLALVEEWDSLLGHWRKVQPRLATQEERREFLRAIDAVKKRTQRRRKPSSLTEPVPDRRDLQERERADKREQVRLASEELLSPRQQKIFQLTVEGWSVQDIAGELQVPAERVSDEKYKAIRKLREHLNPA
jgi:RNA polymerase sigma factor (sigma-70 family)